MLFGPGNAPALYAEASRRSATPDRRCPTDCEAFTQNGFGARPEWRPRVHELRRFG
jgi:hypothetical protein